MALDKLVDSTQLDTDLTSVAAAIRAKGGTSAQLAFPAGFVSAIGAIPSGGGGEAAASKDVNFLDYDGTIVHSYTAAEFAALTALPANPSHDGLTAQGWNWSLSDAKTYVAAYGRLNIGQMYITSDGKTRIYIHLEDGRLSPMLGVCPNGTVTVDWGDASATTALTGTSVSTVKWTSRHTYAAPGDYVITLSVSGSMGIVGKPAANMGSYLLHYSSPGDNRNFGYRSAILRVEIGTGVTSIGTNAFSYCQSLASVTIPSGVTSIGDYAFYHCYSLASVTIPSSVTNIGDYAFYYCQSLASVTIPSSVTSIDTNVFYSCQSLASVTIPSSVTSIGDYAFRNCFSLASVTIPSSVTSIGSYVFYYCHSLGYIKFTLATPPTVANSSAWTNLPTDCIIYVPAGSLAAYTSATNYPSSSTYTYVEY